MSQYPGPNYAPQVPGYQTPYTPRPSPRPTSVTVLAIIGIVFGGLFVLCKPFGLLPLVMPNMGPPNPALDVLRTDGMLRALTIGGVLVGLPVSILLLASSIACLSLKSWARKGMLSYAVIAIVLSALTFVAQVIWVIPKMKAIQQQQMANIPNAAFLAEMTGVPITAVEFLIRLIFPACILFYFTRPHVKAAFENLQLPGGAGYGGGAPYGAPPYGVPQPGGYYAQPPAPPPGQYPPQG
jgi:hypothetical protein